MGYNESYINSNLSVKQRRYVRYLYVYFNGNFDIYLNIVLSLCYRETLFDNKVLLKRHLIIDLRLFEHKNINYNSNIHAPTWINEVPMGLV